MFSFLIFIVVNLNQKDTIVACSFGHFFKIAVFQEISRPKKHPSQELIEHFYYLLVCQISEYPLGIFDLDIDVLAHEQLITFTLVGKQEDPKKEELEPKNK